MKKTTLIASAAMIMAGAAMASAANPFSDVPYSHWAFDAINTMSAKGVIQGFPDGTFKGNQNVTRYQLAMITAKMIANIENGVGNVSKEDMATLEKLTTEFADELALLGVKVTALEDDMATVKEDVAGLKKDVDGIKSYMKNGGMEKVKLSGDMLVRNYGFDMKQGGEKLQDRHHTETVLRLQMDAQIDENVAARARWRVIGNTNGNEWDGANKPTYCVEVAYLQIKDMFGFGGDFKFGRDWYQHGHGFAMFNFMDAINYTKRCGDVDLALNAFFKRQGEDCGKVDDGHQIWNINADYSYKKHDMYLGVYYNTFAYGEDDLTGLPIILRDNVKKTVVELGSHGPISNCNEKVTYDIAGVYSKVDDPNPAAPGVENDPKGWLGHVAVNYDSQKQLTAKVAYTWADEDSFSAVSVDNVNRWCDGDETIFEDIYLASMALAAGHDWSSYDYSFQNLKDLKVQLGYTLKNADKHSFRFAYDNVQQKKNNEDTTLHAIVGSIAGAAPDVKDLKANIITLEYTYRLAENTRIRLGYQNSKIEAKSALIGWDDPEDVKNNLYYAEVYSHF